MWAVTCARGTWTMMRCGRVKRRFERRSRRRAREERSESESESELDARLMEFPRGFEATTVCHPDGLVDKLLFGSKDGRLALVNVRAGKLVHEFAGGAPRWRFWKIHPPQTLWRWDWRMDACCWWTCAWTRCCSRSRRRKDRGDGVGV